MNTLRLFLLGIIVICSLFIVVASTLRIRRNNRKIAYHEKAIHLIAQGRGSEVPPLGTHPDEIP